MQRGMLQAPSSCGHTINHWSRERAEWLWRKAKKGMAESMAAETAKLCMTRVSIHLPFSAPRGVAVASVSGQALVFPT